MLTALLNNSRHRGSRRGYHCQIHRLLKLTQICKGRGTLHALVLGIDRVKPTFKATLPHVVHDDLPYGIGLVAGTKNGHRLRGKQRR